MAKWLIAGCGIVIAVPLVLLLLVGAAPQLSLADANLAGGPSVLALSDIPADYLTLYLGAARTCAGLAWGVLAGIGKVESDHGRSDLPGVHSGANYAGAEGPMQLEPVTFAEFAVKLTTSASRVRTTHPTRFTQPQPCYARMVRHRALRLVSSEPYLPITTRTPTSSTS